MTSLAQASETLAFVVFVAVFALGERLRPRVRVDRRTELATDVGALALLVAVVAAARSAIVAACDWIDSTGALAVLEPLRALPSPLKLVLGLVTADFLLYLTHRAMHGWPLLWRTHRFHHSITELYWLSGFRTSAAHAVIFAVPQMAVPFLLLRATPWEAAIGFSIGAFFQIWNHTSADVSLGPLSRWIVTPAFHRVHHSARVEEQRSNLGMMLTVWDRALGTYVDPDTVPLERPLGLGAERVGLRGWLGL